MAAKLETKLFMLGFAGEEQGLRTGDVDQLPSANSD